MVGGGEEKEEGKGRGDLRGRVEFGTPRKGGKERERERRVRFPHSLKTRGRFSFGPSVILSESREEIR